ncbi:MAG: hypothetical protein FJZ04_01010 [Candidatus Moranbacteria bacterium]|nr:hypothetical protein [Candidatus Moranbacteria bacterium]
MENKNITITEQIQNPETVSESKSVSADTNIEIKTEYSPAKSLFNLAVLFIIGGVYNIYWYGVNWRLLSQYKNYRIRYGWKILVIIITPIFSYLFAIFKLPLWLMLVFSPLALVSVYLVYLYLKDIHDLAIEKNCPVHHYPLTTVIYLTIINILLHVYLISLIYSNSWNNYLRNNPAINLGILLFFLILNFSFLAFLVLAQQTTNEIWRKEYPNLPVRETFSRGEIIFLTVAFLAGWGLTGQILNILKTVYSV